MPSSKIVVLPGHETVKKARKPKRFVYVLMHGITPLAAYETRLAATRAAARFDLWDYEIMRVSVDPLRLAR